tara:strand:- start:263 stop:493 length:231 start_codon:yes stop_codon:yes gene_type:complete
MTRPIQRQHYTTGHITWELSQNPRHDYYTFALIAGEAPEQRSRKPLFTATLNKQDAKNMATDLRRLAHHFDELYDA